MSSCNQRHSVMISYYRHTDNSSNSNSVGISYFDTDSCTYFNAVLEPDFIANVVANDYTLFR